MRYTVNVSDIEAALKDLGGEAQAREIQDHIFYKYCSGLLPENYKSLNSFKMTVQRKMEDYCPQAADYDPTKKEGKFIRISYGLYRLATGYGGKEFPAIEEIQDIGLYWEGVAKSVYVNVYERNAAARSACIEHYGCACVVCGFDFEKVYGELGRSFIHVHHIVKLSDIGKSYVVNPVTDLRPVCANCHAIVHRTDNPISLDVLSSILGARKNVSPP